VRGYTTLHAICKEPQDQVFRYNGHSQVQRPSITPYVTHEAEDFSPVKHTEALKHLKTNYHNQYIWMRKAKRNVYLGPPSLYIQPLNPLLISTRSKPDLARYVNLLCRLNENHKEYWRYIPTCSLRGNSVMRFRLGFQLYRLPVYKRGLTRRSTFLLFTNFTTE